MYIDNCVNAINRFGILQYVINMLTCHGSLSYIIMIYLFAHIEKYFDGTTMIAKFRLQKLLHVLDHEADPATPMCSATTASLKSIRDCA